MRKPKLKWMVSLSLILSMNQTNAMDAQVILKKGKPAPYSGVLEPEDLFRQKEIEIAAKSDFQKQLQICRENRYADIESSELSNVKYGMLGALLGIVVAAAMRK